MPMQRRYHAPQRIRSYHFIKCTKNAPYVVQTIKCWDDIKRIEETIGKTPEEPLKNLYDDIPRCTDNKNLFSINSELQGCYMDDALTKEV